jgi:hypothetical protein
VLISEPRDLINPILLAKFGTSGYYYDEWAGVVYPEGTKQTDYSSFYSGMQVKYQ